MSLADDWKAAWPDALAAWSAYTLLRDPRFLATGDDAAQHGMAGQLAAIRLADHLVMVNEREIVRHGLADQALPVLAHEVGHHVYVPGNGTDHARSIAAMKPMLEGLPEGTVHLVANLYADLLINDRLERRANVDVAAIYRQLASETRGAPASAVWRLYTRVYELLWRRPAGSLGSGGRLTDEGEGDALLAADLVRTFAADWLRGARRFAALLYRYLAEDQQSGAGDALATRGLADTRSATSEGDVPDGLAEIDEAEDETAGTSADETSKDEGSASGSRRPRPKPADDTAPTRDGRGRPGRQYRAPWEYRALLETLGAKLPPHEVTARYYRERALPWLVPFPRRRAPRAVEPLAEGWEAWQPGDAVEALDPLGSVLVSPRLIPGVTTVQRVYGEQPGAEPARVPVDLDVYVDCSGSMPDPSVDVSYLTLTAVILALSALRAGARVQGTLWSSPGTIETTGGFLRDEKRLLHVLTGYVSGGTSFPVPLLHATYAERKQSDPPVHVVVISDDGVDTMLLRHGDLDGPKVAAEALAKARGGGTLVLNLPRPDLWAPGDRFRALGWRVHAVTRWEELLAFARAFVRETYGEKERP